MDSSYDKRLIYKSHYRGMKELDLVFRAFQSHIPELSSEHKKQFDHLLDVSESDLYAWLILGSSVHPDHASLVDLIRKTCL